ncbi:MAG: DDE-type integrase/transposase/recombinase [Rhodospirillaceae bacterium]|nr:DDE-type integrase/transposase/recombinase [Dehalococcoidia bacterium]MYE60308.1 DDE-type integrase/transposase/recombinase [Alphaproteobacteria bacterium]MYI50517.1 DDE-type integrase/transposase/recombinase [Rhodospirillaceae bacterium]
MKEPEDELRQAIALFRYGVIADLAHLPVGTPGTGAMMRAKAEQSYAIPGSTRTRIAAETIRGWITAYRRGGFEALYPKRRTDRGKPRRLPPEVAERLIALKTASPNRSVRAVIAAARSEGIDHPLAPSTVHRLLAREGLFDRKAHDGADRRRFAFREAGELWMSDVMHGPKVRHGRSRRKTYLIAFIDDATRVVPYAAFALAENVPAFLPVFRNALIRRGLPARLYVDNGAAYRSHHLALVCAKLGVALIHARPWQPAGKGKIERFFRTLRAGWLGRIDAAERETLESLNRSLWAWIEGEYHRTPHRGLEGRTPLEQWALASGAVRYPDATLDLDDLFLFEASRRVYKDRTVSLNGRVYEVDALLVGEKVTLRYDPEAPSSRPLDVVHDGKPAGKARRLDAYANTAVRRTYPAKEIEAEDPAPEPPPSPLSLRKLREND